MWKNSFRRYVKKAGSCPSGGYTSTRMYRFDSECAYCRRKGDRDLIVNVKAISSIVGKSCKLGVVIADVNDD